MRISQFLTDDGGRAVAATTDEGCFVVSGAQNVRDLAVSAHRAGVGLAEFVMAQGVGSLVDLAGLLEAGRVLSPLDHLDSARCHATGTGLTHLGSAEARDAMHKKLLADDPASMSDSMRMFHSGLKAGKPSPGQVGVQPEWFYKGDGRIIVAPNAALVSPSFALDAGEEPEIAGAYVIAEDGTPLRIGFVLANEFSDHVMERQNYLYLAHSKLRQVSFGPEILVGPLPENLVGESRIYRNEVVLWESEFLSGEQNMTHSISNLEFHHFKYDLFRRPGDVHLHMFGTGSLSFTAGISAEEGDVFEISIPEFGLPLRNHLVIGKPSDVRVVSL